MITPMLQVIVPVRGNAPFLAAALDSLRAQTFTNWRATLCPLDDVAHGIATSFASADPRLQVADTIGMTEAEARAQAAADTGAELLCVLDGDDTLEPGAFDALLRALADNPDAGMAYSRHVLVDANNRVLGAGPLCELPYSADALLLDCMTGPLRLMRASACRDAGGFACPHADAIDYDLCLRLSETTTVVHVPQPLYRRRIHPLAPEVARWAEGIEARYAAFVDAVKRRGLDAQYDVALHIDSWHILQPLRPFGGAGNWG
ncbi:MAG: glycosyltransferase [Thermomonas sp.]